MKKPAVILILLMFFLLYPAAYSGSADLYPIGRGLAWTYEGYMKSDPKKKIKAVASIVSVEKVGMHEYYYYAAPDVDVRFFVRKDNEWGYMKVVKYPFPVLKFITVDVYLGPEIKFVKFPYQVGDTWEQKVDAEADLKPFKMNIKLRVKFTVMDSEKFTYNGKEYTAYHVRMERREGDSQAVRIEDNWFAEDLGFVKGETPEYVIQLKDFVQPAGGTAKTVME